MGWVPWRVCREVDLLGVWEEGTGLTITVLYMLEEVSENLR